MVELSIIPSDLTEEFVLPVPTNLGFVNPEILVLRRRILPEEDTLGGSLDFKMCLISNIFGLLVPGRWYQGEESSYWLG